MLVLGYFRSWIHPFQFPRIAIRIKETVGVDEA
jgi:hypothetical protein